MDLTKAPVTRSQVEPGRRYSAHREVLRRDFYWQCAYCTRAEREVFARAFHIDHYVPRRAGGSDDYENLYWTCERCNLAKGDWVLHDPPDHRRFVRPDLEHPGNHIVMADDEEFRLKGRTPVGDFQIMILRLNGDVMTKARRLRTQLTDAQEAVAYGLAQLRMVKHGSISRQVGPRLKKAVRQFEAQRRLLNASLEDLLRSPDLDAEPRSERRRAIEFARSQKMKRARDGQRHR